MNLPPDDNAGQDDIAATVADVFGLDLGSLGSQPETPAEGQPPAAGAASVGTDGGAGDGGTVEPPPAPAPSPEPPADLTRAPGAPTPPPVQGEPSPPPSQPAAPAPPPDEAALRLSSVEAQLAQALNYIEEMRQAATAPPAPQPEQRAPGASPQVTPIPVQLPQPMIDAIMGEDPQEATRAINGLVSTIATGLNYRFEARLAQVIAAIEPRLGYIEQAPQEQAAAEEAQRLRDDYFAVFPAHNKPIFQSLLASEAAQLQAEVPGVGWDENFRNALGARMTAKLTEAGFNLGLAPPATNGSGRAAPAPAAPAAFLPTGARPAPTLEDADIISDTFSF